ncbi:hypothetical protein B0H19DRAFT_1089887 [Mycena capillaripes]|nr:hypothetical protein B0H19DRAFT_1089887 [Mycena capillaripes]
MHGPLEVDKMNLEALNVAARLDLWETETSKEREARVRWEMMVCGIEALDIFCWASNPRAAGYGSPQWVESTFAPRQRKGVLTAKKPNGSLRTFHGAYRMRTRYSKKKSKVLVNTPSRSSITIRSSAPSTCLTCALSWELQTRRGMRYWRRKGQTASRSSTTFCGITMSGSSIFVQMDRPSLDDFQLDPKAMHIVQQVLSISDADERSTPRNRGRSLSCSTTLAE